MRRKSKLSTHSIFQWFYDHLISLLGFNSQKQRIRGYSMKRCNRKMNSPLLRKKSFLEREIHMNSTHYLSSLNNNNNNNNIDQQRIICIPIENEEISQWIKYILTLKNIPMFDLQEFVQLSMKKNFQDASTMTNISHSSSSVCINSINQYERIFRLKALEFIRIFLEKSEEDFCRYLINEEHFTREKTSIIYQMIKKFIFI